MPAPSALDLAGKRVVVMGLGRFGGGLGACRYAAAQGAKVLVTDLAPARDLEPTLADLQGLDLAYRLGHHVVEDFATADVVIVNPAVDPRANSYLKAAQDAGAVITSEIRLLVQQLDRARTLGVTGTTGKSTVTAMIGHIFANLRTTNAVHVGGNLGGSLLDRLVRIRHGDWIVLELSSYMLEGLGLDGWSPHIAVLTNFWPNHLDRHGTMAAYAAAKQWIFANQRAGDLAVLDGQQDRPSGLGPLDVVRIEWANSHAQELALSVPGAHNRDNAALACAAAACAGSNRQEAWGALASFKGLEHRLELVACRGRVRYYNDSKSTTPQSAMTAIMSFPAGRVHIILGGYDKGSDLTQLAHSAADHCASLYTIGDTGDAIARAANGRSARVERCGSLPRAVRQATNRARPGDVVLLSPGCASWDQFENYQQRAQVFVEAIGTEPLREQPDRSPHQKP